MRTFVFLSSCSPTLEALHIVDAKLLSEQLQFYILVCSLQHLEGLAIRYVKIVRSKACQGGEYGQGLLHPRR